MLAHAAERGKQVAVLIELQARFDEENNIIWAQRLEDVGVHVSYGVAGLKTHAKVMLVVRREGDTMRRYVHIGTGNYNPKTARLYTDFGLLARESRPRRRPHRPLQRAHRLRLAGGVPQADRGAARDARAVPRDDPAGDRPPARRARPARIIAKMNALVDPDIIAALYEASQAGVPIDLIVRGICCLRPGPARA